MARCWLFAAASLVVAVAVAGEEPAALSIEVRPGFGGLYKVGSTLPVQLTVENRGADLGGRLAIELGGVRVARAVSLPAPSRKLYYLELPAAPWAQELAVELSGPSGAVKQAARLRPVGRGVRLLALARGGRLRPADRSDSRHSGGLRLVSLEASELPESWSGYLGLDGLALDGAAAAALTPARQQALSDWLLLGGRLAILAQRPERLRPVLLEWPMRPLGIGPDAAERLDFSWGRGVVRLRLPLDRVTPESLAAALPGSPLERAAELEPDGYSRAAATGGLRPRPARPLAVLSLLYLAAVATVAAGLGRYGTAGRWRPLLLLGVVALFSLGSGGLGRAVNGGRLLLDESSAIHVFPDADETFFVGRTDYVAPGRGAVELTAELRGLLFDPGEAAGLEEYRQVDPGRSAVVLRPAPWASGRIRWRGFGDSGLRLAARSHRELRIINRSAVSLSDCRSATGGEEVLRERIGPGEELLLSAGALASSGLTRLVCALDPAPVGLETGRPARRMAARGAVVFHLPPRPGPEGASG